MKKRVGFAYALSLGLGVVAFALLMLKLFGPATRWVAVGLYAVGWVFFIFAVRRHVRARHNLARSADVARKVWKEWGQEIVAGVGLSLLGALGFVLMPATSAEFLTQPVEVTRARVHQDVARVKRATLGIERQRQSLLETLAKTDAKNLGDHAAIRQAWASYVDYAIELDQLIDVHKHFYQINPAQLSVERADSFVVGLLALAEQVRNGLAVRDAVKGNGALVTLLDEANPELGLPGHSYFTLNQGLVRADGVLRLQAGLGYLAVLKAQGRLLVDGEKELASQAKDSAIAALRALGSNADAIVDNPMTFFETKAFAAWFPLQKSVANTMGNIRVQDRPFFVDEEKLAALRPKLEPMDVMLERRNWYLTNVGLPGFWPHAALYVGNLEFLDGYFDPALVKSKTGYERLSEYLKEKAPAAYESLSQSDEHGDERTVIEAIGEGVLFQSFEHSGNADYLAILRPRLERQAKLEALLRALSYHLRPYDFDFDFVTDNSIVCSELVYKSLENVGPIHFDLALSAGRMVLTPNQIVQKFDVERGKDGAALDFVAFLDGSETDQCAHDGDAEALAASWRRPKWDIAQP